MQRSNGVSSRRGLTVVEVIVVIVILLVLMGFLIPAMARVRENARKSNCKNHLKQIGLALHNYHDTFIATLPPGYLYHTQVKPKTPTTGLAFNNGWGWPSLILPYLFSGPLFTRFTNTSTIPNLQNGLTGPTGPPAPPEGNVETVIKEYRCPSDSGTAIVVGLPGGLANKPCGRTNYFGVVGSAYDIDFKTSQMTSICSNADAVPLHPKFSKSGDVVPGGLGICLAKENDPLYGSAKVPVALIKDYGGTFGANSKCGFGEMTDGTSNVIVVGERYTPFNSKPTEQTVVGDGIWPGVSSLPAEYNVLGEATYPPNALQTWAKPAPSTTGFGSLHSGGAHFLMADGAVKFINNGIDLKTFRDLSRIANNTKNFGEEF